MTTTKKKPGVGRPPRSKERATSRLEIRCTDAERDRYQRLADKLADGDKSAFFRLAADFVHKATNGGRRKLPKGNTVIDVIFVLLLFALLILRFGVPTLDAKYRGLEPPITSQSITTK